MLDTLSIIGVFISSIFAIVLYVYTWIYVLDDLDLGCFGYAEHPILDRIWVIINAICIAAWFIWSWITVLM